VKSTCIEDLRIADCRIGIHSIPQPPILKCAILKSAILLSLFVLAQQTAFAETRIRVEFKPDDECAVSTTAANGRASVTYPRRTTEMRCAVPSFAQAPAGDVELEVVLLPGQGRPVDAFPRLDWAERDGRWVGTGRLDGVPAFVRIAPDWGPQRWRTLALDVTVVAATALAILWSIIRGRTS